MRMLHTNNTTSLSEDLDRAEEDHLKNCPEADFSLRLAASLFDGILAYLAVSGIQNICRAFGIFLSHIADTALGLYLSMKVISGLQSHALELSSYLEITLKLLFIYIYYIVATSISGGTPGKLLFGLRVLDLSTGKKLDTKKAFLRCLVGLLINIVSLGLVYAFTALKQDRRALHDKLLGCSVKRVHGVR